MCSRPKSIRSNTAAQSTSFRNAFRQRCGIPQSDRRAYVHLASFDDRVTALIPIDDDDDLSSVKDKAEVKVAQVFGKASNTSIKIIVFEGYGTSNIHVGPQVGVEKVVEFLCDEVVKHRVLQVS